MLIRPKDVIAKFVIVSFRKGKCDFNIDIQNGKYNAKKRKQVMRRSSHSTWVLYSISTAWHLIWTNRRFAQVSRYTFQKRAIKINNKSQLLWHLLRMWCSMRDIHIVFSFTSKMKSNSMVSSDQIKYRKSLETDKIGHKIWWGDSGLHLTSLNDLRAILLTFFFPLCTCIYNWHWLLDMIHETNISKYGACYR